MYICIHTAKSVPKSRRATETQRIFALSTRNKHPQPQPRNLRSRQHQQMVRMRYLTAALLTPAVSAPAAPLQQHLRVRMYFRLNSVRISLKQVLQLYEERPQRLGSLWRSACTYGTVGMASLFDVGDHMGASQCSSIILDLLCSTI